MDSQSVQPSDPPKTSKRKEESNDDDDNYFDDQSLTSKFFLTDYPEHLTLFCTVDVQFEKIEVVQVCPKDSSLTKSCQIEAEQNPFQ